MQFGFDTLQDKGLFLNSNSKNELSKHRSIHKPNLIPGNHMLCKEYAKG